MGNLIQLPTIVPEGGEIFESGLRTGAQLPYVERHMEQVLVDDLRSDSRESLSGLTIDEQRVVVVKVRVSRRVDVCRDFLLCWVLEFMLTRLLLYVFSGQLLIPAA